MSDVQVTVTIPAPPEGMEWVPAYGSDLMLRDASGKEYAYRTEWKLRPIAPAYVDVYARMKWQDAVDLAEVYGDGKARASVFAALGDAARTAVGPKQDSPQPAYVYPKVRREDAEKYVEWYNGSHRPFMNIVAAMREALEAKGEPEVAHGKCCLCAVRNPSTVWNPRPIVSGPQPKVTVGEPEPVCGKHHHDGWEYRHNEGAVLCSQPNCRLPLKHADHDGTHI